MTAGPTAAGGVERFTLAWRIQHFLLLVGVTGLALTGLAYRWYDTPFGQFLIQLEGGFGTRGVLHRISAVLLGLAVVWHVGRVLFSRSGHDDFLALMPEKGDWGRWRQALKSKAAGEEIEVEWGRYTLGQKIQYWAVAIGTLLMIATGLTLLLGDRAVAALPKWMVDIVRVAHGGQGVELMIFIVLWHLYSTHLSPGRFPMDRSWLTGKISIEQLRIYHRREYRRLFGEEKRDAV